MSIFFQILASSIKNNAQQAQANPLYNKDVVMVFDGNSLTLGTYNSDNAIQQYYPKQVSAYYDGVATTKEFYSYGVNAQTTQNMLSDTNSQIYPLATNGKVNILVAWEDANSIDLGRTAQQNFDDFITYFQGARTAGFQHCFLITGYYPRTPYAAGFTLVKRDEQHLFFEMVKDADISSVSWDYHIDLRDAPNIGGFREQSQNSYFGDYLHLHTIGYDVIAQQVINKINQILT